MRAGRKQPKTTGKRLTSNESRQWCPHGDKHTAAKRDPLKILVLDLFSPGPGGLCGPREAPQGHPLGFGGLPGALRKHPGPTMHQTKKPMSQKETIEQSSNGDKHVVQINPGHVWYTFQGFCQ